MQVGAVQVDGPVEHAVGEAEREGDLHPAQIEIAADSGALDRQPARVDLLAVPPAQLTDQAAFDDEFLAVLCPQNPACRAGPQQGRLIDYGHAARAPADP